MMLSILSHLLSSTLFLAVNAGIMFGLLRLVDSRSSLVHRTAWTAVLLSGVLWFRIPLEVPAWMPLPPPMETTETVPFQEVVPNFIAMETTETTAETITTAFSSGVVPTMKPSFRWTTDHGLYALFGIWIVGIVWRVGHGFVAWIRMLQVLKETIAPEGVFKTEWESLLADRRISSQRVRLVISDHTGPGLVRLLRNYAIVVPRSLWEEADAAVRRGILKHELSHFAHGDLPTSFALRLIALIHWFNPAAAFAVRRFEDALEWRCDAEAFGRYESGVADFARALLAFRDTVPITATYRRDFCGNNIVDRGNRLVDAHLNRGDSIMKKTTMACCVLLLLCGNLLRVEFVAGEPGTAKEPGTVSPIVGSQHWTSVIDAEMQKPLAGVKATLYFAKPGGTEVDSRTAISDEQGQILFPLPSELNADMEAGTMIQVEKEGYVTERGGRQAKWAERFLHEKRLVCDVFPLQKAESLTCRFVDEQGKPLADVLIAVFRQKVRPYGNEGLNRTESHEFRSDAEGRFRFEAAKNEKVVFWAVPENLAPKYVFPDQQRGDLGDITVEKGFEPVVTVLDKDGKPVQDVWVNLSRQFEGYNISIGPADVRSALTDQDGNTRFRPVSEGDYDMRVSERPMERYYSPWGNMSAVTWRANADMHKKPVKGVYLIPTVKLSAASMTATIQGQSVVTIDVQFSDKTTDSYRELNTNIYGRQEDGSFFSTRPSSDSPSAYRGDGLFSFEVPVGLEKAEFRVHSDTNMVYRAKLRGEDEWVVAERGMDFPLGTIEKELKLDVTVYESPKITLNVVDVAGQPVKEFYAWLEYVSNGTPARVEIKGDKIRVDITPERYYEVDWDFATSKLPLGGILDVSFKYKNFGKSEAKINSDGILPDEEMRLHIVGRGYVITSQEVPKMAEGEERELTVILKKD